MLWVRELNNVEMDSVSQKLVASVHLFYHDTGTAAPLKISAKEVIGKYNRLLDGSLAKGIRTKQDVIDFLRKEDVAFRSFLLHLPALSAGNISLEGITRKTGEIMHGIISLSTDEISRVWQIRGSSSCWRYATTGGCCRMRKRA